jgi:hypothetical protein
MTYVVKTILMTVVFLGLASAVGFAQATHPQGVKTIFDFKAELRLSDTQEKDIKQILADLTRELQLEKAKHTIAAIELQDLVRQDVDLGQIRRALDQEAGLRASMTYVDIAATRKINHVLSPDQLQKWRTIQESARSTSKD